ncbi:MAG: YtxH domain-containing protein [Bacteroidota bacterium]
MNDLPPTSPGSSSLGSSVRGAVVGTLIGGAVGFGLGLLLAPDKGAISRRRFAFMLDSWAQGVAGWLDRMDAEATERDARQSSQALVADAQKQAEALLEEAESLMKQARARRGA